MKDESYENASIHLPNDIVMSCPTPRCVADRASRWMLLLTWALGTWTSSSPAQETLSPGAPHDMESIGAFQRDVLAAGLARAEQNDRRLQQRLPPLKTELQQMIAQLERTTVPPKTGATPEPQTKKVEFRPPLAYAMKKKKKQIALVCENRRITVLDASAFQRAKKGEDIQKQVQEALVKAASTKTSQLVTIVPDEGHFDQHFQINAKDGSLSFRVTGHRKTGHDGETDTCLLNTESELRRVVDSADPEETYVYFAVYPSSFDIFRQVRQYVWAKGNFEVGWVFLDANEVIGFGGGGNPLGQ